MHGAIDGMLESIGATPLPILRADHESSIAAARAALDEKAFAESFAKERKLSAKEIINFALSSNGETKSAFRLSSN